MHPDDLPPPLEWEQPVWDLYALVSTQWRCSMTGPVGLDYNPAIALMQAKGWHLERGLTLLRAIEHGLMNQPVK